MSIGEDIKEVFEELGVPVTIYQITGTSVSGEYVDHDDTYFETSTEFIRQFSFSGSFAYDTQALSGSIIEYLGKFALVLNLQAVYLEAVAITKDFFCVDCNCLGKFQRFSKGVRDSNYELTPGFVDTLGISVHALQYEQSKGLDALGLGDPVVMTVDTNNNILFVPGYEDIKSGDRWFPDADDPDVYLKIDSIHTKRFSGCKVCYLVEDTR